MIIKRELQHATWVFNTQTSELTIRKVNTNVATDFKYPVVEISLTKIEAFSLCRFLIRCFQTMGRRPRKEVK